uniref:C3H1-type domain-containing protein n=1 Tax=Eutrema halophilum TaxID=98038 RepID=Q0ZR52_EUTHA|nr:hypothetical protein [Eutrema halophilum]
MFRTEDCPSKVAPQTTSKPKASNLPTQRSQGNEYETRRNMSHIPRIKWKHPRKFILNDDMLVASGGESTETRCENLRIAKVLEAFYPHRSLIPSRPLVSPAVEDESYDDSKTPNIRLTPIEDEDECEPISFEPSHSSKSPAAVFGLGPEDLTLAALSALLMKTKEQESLVDADLLVKFLSDPKLIKNLMMNDTTAMDGNPPPEPVTQPGGNGVPHIVPVSVQSSALPMNLNLQKPPLVFHTYPLSGLEDSLKPSSVDDVLVSDQKTVPNPDSQSLIISTSSTWDMKRVLESAQTITDAQIRNGAYPMTNINQDDGVSAKQPVRNLDYFKNLIREHGGVAPGTNETNNYKARVDNNSNNNKKKKKKKLVKVRFQKPCKYFGRGRGCKLGESCLYLHDRSKRLGTDVAPDFPRAKRLKFGT